MEDLRKDGVSEDTIGEYIGSKCLISVAEAYIRGTLSLRVAETRLRIVKSQSTVRDAFTERGTPIVSKPFRDFAKLSREKEMLEMLEHPRIVKLLGGDRTHLWFESLRSLPLVRVAKMKHFALELHRQMSEALAYVHSFGYAHCDVKPDNVMLVPNAESLSFKLIDFGAVTQIGSLARERTRAFTLGIELAHPCLDFVGLALTIIKLVQNKTCHTYEKLDKAVKKMPKELQRVLRLPSREDLEELKKAQQELKKEPDVDS